MNERILEKLQEFARRMRIVTARLIEAAAKFLKEERVKERALEMLQKLAQKMPIIRQRAAALFAKLPLVVKLCGGAVAVSTLIVVFAALLPRHQLPVRPSDAQPEVAAASSASGEAEPQAAAFAPGPSRPADDVLATQEPTHSPGTLGWREVVAMTNDELDGYFVLHGFPKLVKPRTFDAPDPRLAHLDPFEAEVMADQLAIAETIAQNRRDSLGAGATAEELAQVQRQLDVTLNIMLPRIKKTDRDAIRDRALRTPSAVLDNSLTASLSDDALPLLQRLQSSVTLIAEIKRRTAALGKGLSESEPLLRRMAAAFHRYPLASQIASLLSDAPPDPDLDRTERVAERLHKLDAAGMMLRESRLAAFVEDLTAFLESQEQVLSRKQELANRLPAVLGTFAYHPHEYTTNVPPHIAARMRHAYAMACDDLGGIVKSRWTWPRDHLPITYEHWYRWATDRDGFYAGAQQLALDRDRFPPNAPQTHELFVEFQELVASDGGDHFLSPDEVLRFNASPPPAWP